MTDKVLQFPGADPGRNSPAGTIFEQVLGSWVIDGELNLDRILRENPVEGVPREVIVAIVEIKRATRQLDGLREVDIIEKMRQVREDADPSAAVEVGTFYAVVDYYNRQIDSASAAINGYIEATGSQQAQEVLRLHDALEKAEKELQIEKDGRRAAIDGFFGWLNTQIGEEGQ